jgi:hypothetical protein
MGDRDRLERLIGIAGMLNRLLRLILRWMWKRPHVVEHLPKIAHIDPCTAVVALNEMLGFVFRLLADAPTEDLAGHSISRGYTHRVGPPFLAARRGYMKSAI